MNNQDKAIYAILADNVYWDVRKGGIKPEEQANSNWTPVPDGWSILTKADGTPFEMSSSTQNTTNNPVDKFTARAYQKLAIPCYGLSYSKSKQPYAIK